MFIQCDCNMSPSRTDFSAGTDYPAAIRELSAASTRPHRSLRSFPRSCSVAPYILYVSPFLGPIIQLSSKKGKDKARRGNSGPSGWSFSGFFDLEFVSLVMSVPSLSFHPLTRMISLFRNSATAFLGVTLVYTSLSTTMFGPQGPPSLTLSTVSRV